MNSVSSKWNKKQEYLNETIQLYLIILTKKSVYKHEQEVLWN